MQEQSAQHADLLTPWQARSKRSRIAVMCIVTAAYVVAAQIGLSLSLDETSVTPVWPPSGIAMAAVFAFGWRAWPGVFAGAMIANTVQFAANSSAGWTYVALGALMVAVGNTAEAFAGRVALEKFCTTERPFDRVQDTFKFVFVSIAAPVVAACVGVLAMVLLGVIVWQKALESWLTWWLGDAVGILVYAPVILAWTWRRHFGWPALRFVEAGLLSAALLATGFALFAGGVPEPMVRSLPYLVMPPLLWVVFRFSLREAASAVVLVAAIATWGTARGLGPFSEGSLNESLLMVQSFVGTVAVTVLALCAVLHEKVQHSQELRRLTRSLEGRVAERTAELSRANDQLSNEVHERKRAEEAVRHMAQHDSLTGLANRRLLGALFDSVEALARRRDGKMALLFVDLDDFKTINDELGHLAGDRVLMSVASRLEAAVRESDIVARFGGDEFIVVLPELAQALDAQHVADKILSSLTKPMDIGDEPRSLGASIGIATYPKDARALEGLVRCADIAMYGVKQRGKNGISFFEAPTP